MTTFLELIYILAIININTYFIVLFIQYLFHEN